MSVIYSFLQKRKMHESQYGFVLVFIAYVLSAMMLILGSDVFYEVNSSAATLDISSNEETYNLINIGLFDLQQNGDTVRTDETNLIDPYGLIKNMSDEADASSTTSISGDTLWIFGNSMDGKTFDQLMEQVACLELKTTSITQPDETSQSDSGNDKKDISTLEDASKEESTETFSNVTSKELNMLERIVQAEAGGEDMKGKILIVNVIMNRVEDGDFPNTIKGVIFQKSDGKYQFSPVASNKYSTVHVSSDTKKAVKRALQGEDYSKGALYFVARKRTNAKSIKWFDQNLDWLFVHGGHEFYKNK